MGAAAVARPTSSSVIHSSGSWVLSVMDNGCYRVAGDFTRFVFTSPVSAVRRYEDLTGETITLGEVQ